MRFLLLIFIIINIKTLYASSCCGGGSSSSLIIVGDNSEEYGLGLTYKNDLGQTDNQGWGSFHGENIVDKQMSFNFQYQRILTERVQFAAKSALFQKNITKQNRHETITGLGDFELQSTFEFLPEFTYSIWKPRGFVFFKLAVPMSKSLYDSSSAIFTDVRGSGLYSFSIGSLFIKRLSDFTIKTTFEWQHYLGKRFAQTSIQDYEKFIIPASVSYGISSSPFTYGAGATWSYQTPKKFYGAVQSNANQEYFWELSTFVNWTLSRAHMLGLSYGDSTLVGKNINSSLYRTLSLSYIHSAEL